MRVSCLARGRVATVAPAAQSPHLYESQFVCTAVAKNGDQEVRPLRRRTPLAGPLIAVFTALSVNGCKIKKCLFYSNGLMSMSVLFFACFCFAAVKGCEFSYPPTNIHCLRLILMQRVEPKDSDKLQS